MTVLTPEQKRTRRGFLREIRANPDDDTPRLIFADWLEDDDKNPLWASLIRAQVAYADLDDKRCRNTILGFVRPLELECEGSDWTKKVSRRCQACRLVAESQRVRDHWTKAIPSDPFVPMVEAGGEGLVAWWSRGFIAEVKGFDFDWWHKWGPRICQEHPVEKVGLEGAVKCVQRSRASAWVSLTSWFPAWFRDYYNLLLAPDRKTQDEATNYINHVLLDWAQCEAAKLDEIEDAKENQ